MGKKVKDIRYLISDLENEKVGLLSYELYVFFLFVDIVDETRRIILMKRLRRGADSVSPMDGMPEVIRNR